jgi:seryl-tRNA synthetase
MDTTDLVKEMAQGQYLFLPKAVRKLNQIKKLIQKYVQDEVGFEEVWIPKTIPEKTIGEDRANILGIWDQYLLAVNPYGETEGLEETHILDPLQCLALYQALENETLESLPLRYFDVSGPTYRNEDISKIEVLVKQREFHRAEFVYIGTPAQVRETRDGCLGQLVNLCTDLGLEHRVVEGDGCYQENGDIKDIEVYIPQDNLWLEVAGAAVLYEHLVKAFNITFPQQELWSGCTGIGLERMLYSVLSYEVDLDEHSL